MDARRFRVPSTKTPNKPSALRCPLGKPRAQHVLDFLQREGRARQGDDSAAVSENACYKAAGRFLAKGPAQNERARGKPAFSFIKVAFWIAAIKIPA